MKKILLLIILMLIPAVSAASVSDWPYMFVKDGIFSAVYVVGAEAPSLDVVSATLISSSLQRYENLTTEVGTSKLDSEIGDINKYDAIVIGSPCENKAAAQLLGNPSPCDKGLNGSTGYIQIFENFGKVQLLITGLHEKDRKAAAVHLSGSDLSNINTDIYAVQSGSGSKSAEETKIEAKPEKNETKANVTEENITEVPELIEPEIIEPVEVEEPEEPKGFFAKVWHWFKSLFTFY